MKWMVLIFLGGFLAHQPAAATVDVTCRNGDCLQSGWAIEDLTRGLWGEARCVEGDCRGRGWEIVDSQGQVTSVFCLEGGCFSAGWVEVPARATHLRVAHICGQGELGTNCLLYGWAARGPQGNSMTICRNEDCSHDGWITRSAQGDLSVWCKTGGCFTSGWRVYP